MYRFGGKEGSTLRRQMGVHVSMRLNIYGVVHVRLNKRGKPVVKIPLLFPFFSFSHSSSFLFLPSFSILSSPPFILPPSSSFYSPSCLLLPFFSFPPPPPFISPLFSSPPFHFFHLLPLFPFLLLPPFNLPPSTSSLIPLPSFSPPSSTSSLHPPSFHLLPLILSLPPTSPTPLPSPLPPFLSDRNKEKFPSIQPQVPQSNLGKHQGKEKYLL